MADAFYPLTVTEVRRETPDAVSLRLDVPENLRAQFRFRAGQHLTIRRVMNGEEIRRNYSLCVAPREGEWRIAVKRIANGMFSSFANQELRAGDTLEAMPPHGSFTWDYAPAARRAYVAFAGGSGITPILSLAKTALAEEPRSTFTLLYGNRASRDVIFLEELAALKDRYMGRFRLFHFLEDEEEEIALFNGRFDRGKCDEILSALIDPAGIDAFFICGPGPMMDAAQAALLARGVQSERIRIERFLTTPLTEAQLAAARALERKAAGLVMSVTIGGKRAKVAFDPAKGSILDSVRAAGFPAPYACKGGVCATCRARVTEGKVEMKQNFGLTPKEVGEGFVLTCQAAPVTEGVALTYDL
ncbi:MAG: 2Fe-2S iron-sulfur cluster-binding protein [Alphaproteobacteria bacterium]